MPQLSEVARFGPSLVNPYADVPDSIESRAWLLWRAAVGTAQRTGTPIGKSERFGAKGYVFTTALRSVAKDLFAGVPKDLAAVYAFLKDSRNAVCLDRGSRGVTPLWWFRAEFNTDGPIAEVTQLPIEQPEPVAKPRKQTRSRMAKVDQRAAILKVLAQAEHPAYLEEVAKAVKLNVTTVRDRMMELIADERAFRRHETLDERDGTPGRRHHLYWASAEIPLRPAELFKPSTRKSGSRPGYVAPPSKTVLRRVEELQPGGMVSLSNATIADRAGIDELMAAGVIEYVNAETQKEVRLTTAASARPRPKPLDDGKSSYVEENWSKATESIGGDVHKSDIDGYDKTVTDLGVENLGAKLEAGLKSLIEAEVARRIETRVANEVAELERRLSASEAQRVTAQTELSVLKGRVQNLLG